MKCAGAMVSVFVIGMYAGGQQPQSNDAATRAPSIGLEVGSKIPAFQLRSEESKAVLRNAEGDQRNGPAVFPLGGLVTVLQSAAGAAAGSKRKIRDARDQAGSH